MPRRTRRPEGPCCCAQDTAAALASAGARLIKGSALKSAHGCSLDVRASCDTTVLHRLELDREGASYLGGNGQQSPICDFAVVWETTGLVSIAVVEMKSGRASDRIVAQLEGGLNILIGHIPSECSPTLHAAILVAGKLEAQLQNLVRARKLHLTHNGRRCDVSVTKPGAKIALP